MVNADDIVDKFNVGTSSYVWTDGDALKAPFFGLGAANGNSYTTNTRAVYYRSARNGYVINGDLTTTRLSYVRESSDNIVRVTDGAGNFVRNYWLAPNVKVVGELEWLNDRGCDVTIVFEEGVARSITQIYITPDPDVTPSSPNNPGASVAGSVNVTNLDSILPPPITNAGIKDTITPTPNTTRNDIIKFQDDGLYRSSYDLSPLQDVINPTTIVYLKFSIMPNTASTTATLVIRDANGNRVYQEAGTFTNTYGVGKFFYITTSVPGQEAGAVPKNKGTCYNDWATLGCLPAGTYTYNISGSGVNTVYGSFTVN